MAEVDLDRLADKMWQRATKARSFTNKQVTMLVIVIFVFASGLGVTWNKILGFPAITREQWNNVYGYAVVEKTQREIDYKRDKTELALKNQEQDLYIKELKVLITEFRIDVKEIKKSIANIEKENARHP